MPETEHAAGITEIDETIGRMEQLYQTLTGRAAPRNEAPYAPIPAEQDPAEHVEKQLNELLTLLGGLGGGARPLPLTSWTPAMSVWESHTEIRICLDLPGVPRDHVQVVAQGKLLTISGNRSAPKTDEGTMAGAPRKALAASAERSRNWRRGMGRFDFMFTRGFCCGSMGVKPVKSVPQSRCRARGVAP